MGWHRNYSIFLWVFLVSTSNCVKDVKPRTLQSQPRTLQSQLENRRKLGTMLKFKMKSSLLYFPLQSSLDYSSCHATQETSDLCEGTNLSEFTKTEGGSAVVWRHFLRAVISWWLNQIRALRFCLLLVDNLITIFLLSFLIAISLLLTFTPPDLSRPVSPPFCSLLSPWPTPLTSISLSFFPTPTFSSGSVGHNDCPGRTGLEDISCQWGEWKANFLLSEYSKLNLLS